MRCHREESPPRPPPREGNPSRPLKSMLLLCKIPGIHTKLRWEWGGGRVVLGVPPPMTRVSQEGKLLDSSGKGPTLVGDLPSPYLRSGSWKEDRRLFYIEFQTLRVRAAEAPLSHSLLLLCGHLRLYFPKGKSQSHARGLTHGCPKHRREVWGYSYHLLSPHYILFLSFFFLNNLFF